MFRKVIRDCPILRIRERTVFHEYHPACIGYGISQHNGARPCRVAISIYRDIRDAVIDEFAMINDAITIPHDFNGPSIRQGEPAMIDPEIMMGAAYIDPSTICAVHIECDSRYSQNVAVIGPYHRGIQICNTPKNRLADSRSHEPLSPIHYAPQPPKQLRILPAE
jgi:hypothetical protein